MSEDSAKIFVDESSDRFPCSEVLQKIRPFFKRKRQKRFTSTVLLSPLRERIVARLSEDSAKMLIIGLNLSEDSANLPAVEQSGKLTEGWTNFASKGGNLH